MKNKNFETRRKRKWKSITARPVTVTRAMLIRAFSTPDRSRQDVLSVVAQYMGDSPVPPAWGRAGVRGTFGRKIERLWSRHIQGLRLATYLESGRGLTPVVQTAYDFGAEIMVQKSHLPGDKDSVPLLCLDEYWLTTASPTK